MKILFLLTIGLDRHETSEHLLTAIIEQLCINGHSVHIIQKKTGGDLDPIPPKLSGYEITTDTIPFSPPSKNKFLSRYIVDIKYLLECKKRIKQEYDAVFIQSNKTMGLAVKLIKGKLPGARITINVQDIFPYNAFYVGKIKNKLLFHLLASEERYGYKHCDQIITISEDMKETLVQDGVDPEKIHVIYNWSYNDQVYKIPEKKEILDLFDPDYFNVVYAGNIGVMQNVNIVIEAAGLLKDEKDIWFHVIGNGLYKEKLIRRAKELGIDRISFWPMQPPEQACKIYSSADINLIPLAENIYKTALPSKTATCFACQKPIIFATGAEGEFAKRVRKETGCVFVDSNDPDQLKNSIIEVKNHKVKCDTSEFFQKYMSISQNSNLYSQIIQG